MVFYIFVECTIMYVLRDTREIANHTQHIFSFMVSLFVRIATFHDQQKFEVLKSYYNNGAV